ncbi:tetratricopeptide repeat protein [Pseudomonas viridiflava]|uniref:tetratricopeptide repeat protein n=1 Tax=Pseudomonas viridiflava TaxID=33069 RepID=UPI000F06FF06|nr:sel1 repeat family protein [Pseudomonas viridiflava]
MNRVFKKNSVFAIIFAACSWGGFLDRAYAEACPSEDFSKFLTVFSATPEVQQRFTAVKVQALVLKPAKQTDRFEPQTTDVANASLAYPLMGPIISDKTDGVQIEAVDDRHVRVIDKRAGHSDIKVFNFSRQTCWVLAGMEDWSISEKDLSAAVQPKMNRSESLCFQRGRAYAGLGGVEQYPLTAEFFEAALENYVCAAASGDPQASLNAASLSLSGMAPQLETEKVEALFKAASTTLADGAAGLSSFYCYGNNVAADGPCQHPEQAEKELVRAVSMGSSDATNYLGYTLETGELRTTDLDRAIACYRLAASMGNQTAADNLKRLSKQASDVSTAGHCY